MTITSMLKKIALQLGNDVWNILLAFDHSLCDKISDFQTLVYA